MRHLQAGGLLFVGCLNLTQPRDPEPDHVRLFKIYRAIRRHSEAS